MAIENIPPRIRSLRVFGRVAVVALGIGAVVPALAQSRTDSDIRRQMIRESIASYTGNCPCPYNIMRNGKECGRFSAWSKPGGQSPLCYDKDIPDTAIEAYRRQHSLPR